MNDWEDAYIDDQAAALDAGDYRPDDDGPDYEETTELCPLCRAYLVYVLADGHLHCQTCDVGWDDLAAVNAEREQVAR
jgi:hypothetical protein